MGGLRKEKKERNNREDGQNPKLYCSSLVIRRRFVFRIQLHHLGDRVVPDFLVLFPLSILSGVQPLAIRRVDRLRGGRPEKEEEEKQSKLILVSFFALNLKVQVRICGYEIENAVGKEGKEID